MPEPFLYPAYPHVRRHGPVYATYQSYRPWLRDEFSFRCVYCLKREQWAIVRGTFDIDHFIPQQIAPGRATEYENLVYSCATCNAAKRTLILPDPTQALAYLPDLTSKHPQRNLKPAGLRQSYRARRERGELPPIY